MGKPILSIGMIVKNEIRCLEKCLTALQPLRDAIPCQLVIADTGSDDGTREIAEQYADVLFDFPWINDFSAARNAVMDRCTGQWFLSVDADEYLKPDIEELLRFLTSSKAAKTDFCVVYIRNYKDPEMAGAYSEFPALRMVRMALGGRYEGVIHEKFAVTQRSICVTLQKTILDHDGYVYLSQEDEQRKGERNLALLEPELEKNPKDLFRMLQCLESAFFSAEKRFEYAHRAMELAMESGPSTKNWENVAPAIACRAVNYGLRNKIPETENWISWARKHFPNSPFVQISINVWYIAELYADARYEEVITSGKSYFLGLRKYHRGEYPTELLTVSSVFGVHKIQEDEIRGIVGASMAEEGQYQEALRVLEKIDLFHASQLTATRWFDTLEKLREEKGATQQAARMVGALLQPEDGNGTQGEERRNACLRRVALAFQGEQKEERVWRLYREMPGNVGLSAQLLDAQEADEAEQILCQLDSWDDLMPAALFHAVALGARVPDIFWKQSPEQLREVASDWANQEPFGLASWLLDEERINDIQEWEHLSFLFDAFVACLMRVELFDPETNRNLVQRYAEVANSYLEYCYTPALLKQEMAVSRLPGMHRFAWYFLRAQAQREVGDAAAYVRLLRAALKQAPVMKDFVKFLMEQVEPQAIPQASPELLALAEQVRTILAAYPADDPAVAALKASEAYQKVAYLLEEPAQGPQ